MPVRCPIVGASSLAALIVAGLSGCSTVQDTLAPAKVDYRSAAASTAPTLQVPPDLSQLSSDPRYQPPVGAAVSANAVQAANNQAAGGGDPGAAASTPTATTSVPPAIKAAVAPPRLSGTGEVRIERSGAQRWLVTRQSPEQVWPALRTFWQDNGFTLVVDTPQVGVMETDWAENRAKLPDDMVSRTIGKVLDKLRDTGERDRFRTRVERNGADTEIYISHRGAAESGGDASKDTSVRWQNRSNDPGLEAEMLGRLMLRLSGQDGDGKPSQAALETATRAVIDTPSTPAHARVLTGQPGATLQIDDTAEHGWRRLGLALDRSGFTVEDRNRTDSTYAVRYVDPKLAGKEEPGFFSRVFGAKKEDLAGTRYRLKLAADSKNSAISILTVLNEQGAPVKDDGATNIVKLLETELR